MVLVTEWMDLTHIRHSKPTLSDFNNIKFQVRLMCSRKQMFA